MTSRERVVAALRHQETDRVPVDLGGMRSTGTTAIAYNRLKAHLALPRPGDGWPLHHTRVYDVIQQLAEPDIEILDRFGADVVDLSRAFLTEPGQWRPWTLPDGSPAVIPPWFDPEPDGAGGWVVRDGEGGVMGAMPAGVQYVTQRCHPLREASSAADFADLGPARAKVTWFALPCAPWHLSLDSPEGFDEIRGRARALHGSCDRAIMAALGGNILEAGQFLCGMDRFLMMLAEDEPLACALMDRLVEDYLKVIPRFFEAVGDSVQVVQMGDDLGTQTASQISPAMYRRLVKPRHRIVYEAVHKHFGGFLFLHSCGDISALIPDLIDVGVDVINPVQTSCPGMQPEVLKREFGRDLSFWGGGCDTQTVLRTASPAEVRRHVRDRVATFAPGGGFVFTQVHNIMADVPPPNVLAMYEAVAESGN